MTQAFLFVPSCNLVHLHIHSMRKTLKASGYVMQILVFKNKTKMNTWLVGLSNENVRNCH